MCDSQICLKDPSLISGFFSDDTQNQPAKKSATECFGSLGLLIETATSNMRMHLWSSVSMPDLTYLSPQAWIIIIIYPYRPVPDLPGKSFFSFNNEDFLEKRRKGLQIFLEKSVLLLLKSVFDRLNKHFLILFYLSFFFFLFFVEW